ncbi:MAG: endolytic transglycosylase MltG [Leptolyngbya sp. SIO4C1]|nr:endolytic transglycosylase MltG [Leptolyngbya sp. SIO4C1]
MKLKLFRRILYLATLAFFAGIAWQSWAWWSWAKEPVQAEATEPDELVQIQIPSGTSAQQIGQDLEAAGLIRSTTAWKLLTRWKLWREAEGGFQAGTYAVSPSQPLAEIAEQIWSGDVVELSFTIPEGWNRGQMAASLASQGLVSADEFLAATEQIPYDRYPWLPQALPHLEGFLYPDTYQLPSEAISAEAIIDMMLTRFEQVALPLYQQQRSRYDLVDWVTLASIVEKEAVIADERSTIASVFARRLEEGMTLGADPTVEYGLGVTQTPENPLTLAQVNTPNDYNTYLNPGLPPTPIASPGLASLEASLNPPYTDYLYFVARYDGTHVFSSTLAEHEIAQARIRDGIDAQQENPEIN